MLATSHGSGATGVDPSAAMASGGTTRLFGNGGASLSPPPSLLRPNGGFPEQNPATPRRGAEPHPEAPQAKRPVSRERGVDSARRNYMPFYMNLVMQFHRGTL